MLLINSLLKNATDSQWQELADQLERLNLRKAVIVRRLQGHQSLAHLDAHCFPAAAHLVNDVRGIDFVNIGIPSKPYVICVPS